MDSGVDLIVVRGTPEALAIHKATSTLPVVMSAVVDPVDSGLADTLAHPGKNFTGLASIVTELEAKRIQYLKDVVPGIERIAFLGDFRNPSVRTQWHAVEIAAQSLNVKVEPLTAQSTEGIYSAFDTADKKHIQAFRVGIDGLTRPNRKTIVDLARAHEIPIIYAAREFVDGGGLMSYAADYSYLYWRAAYFVDRIFRGAKPQDIPIEIPTKYEFVVNLNTAKRLGIVIPATVLSSADSIIE
ncbi:ABC transporter substrate-binding protein [Methylobacterium sp. P31]